MLRDAFDAGVARAIASHRDFRQTHPSREEYVAQVMGEGVRHE
jgi:hypothetical protein